MSTKKIAIDGPAGAGKSTIAKAIAAKLGYIYVDTGAMYRSVALYCIRSGVSTDDEDAVTKCLCKIDIDIAYENGAQQIYLCGENVSELIRTPEVSMGASDVSKFLSVREMLVNLQREIAKKHNVIMDGRDIGTVVLPDAKIKIFLSASPECRARRRYDELIEKGMDVKYEDILSDVIARDYADSHRDIAPLKPADDAISVDTSGEDLETSVNKLLGIMREKL